MSIKHTEDFKQEAVRKRLAAVCRVRVLPVIWGLVSRRPNRDGGASGYRCIGQRISRLLRRLI